MLTHMGRLNLSDVPDPDSELFEDHARAWEARFAQVRAFEAEVDRASLAVLAAPTSPNGWWWRDQLPAIVHAIEAARADNPARPEFPDDAPQSRAEAERASRTCDICSGSGWAEVFHRDYAGRPTIETVNSDHTTTIILARFRLACLCPHGRWLLRANEKAASEVEDSYERERRVLEARSLEGIRRVMEGHTDYTCFDPTAPRDVDVPQTTNWRAHVAAWAEAAKVPSNA